MKIWIITIYEPLPFGHPETKPQRCGMLAHALMERGHDVEIWTSAFDHINHRHYYKNSYFVPNDERLAIQYIKGSGYPHDQSIKRYFHNRQTGVEFFRLAQSRNECPDIIFAPVPILELAEAAVRFANQKSIPIIVDVRDLWPDVYFSFFPKFVHQVVRLLLFFEFRRAEFIFQNASGITAISRAYLNKGLEYGKRSEKEIDRFFPLGSISSHSSNSNFNFDKLPLSKVDNFQNFLADVHNCFIITYVGTFSKFIDMQNIFDAANLLLGYKAIKIIIVGSGDNHENFLDQSQQLSNVLMTGWLDAQSVKLILKHTDVGLAAYSKKAPMSLPNKPFEYMAAGLPLLSSLKGELEELIQIHNIGQNYQAGNPESLAKKIQWFYDNPAQMLKMSENSLSLFSQKFCSEKVYKKFAVYLERMANIRNNLRS
nr:glycosyltransferase family 4 protein [uncultured Desulfobacter sp.]